MFDLFAGLGSAEAESKVASGVIEGSREAPAETSPGGLPQ
jgi:hypothetical protein